MEGTLFPSRPVYPIPANRPTQPNPPVKFNSTTLPPPPQSRAPPFPIDSLLQHLLNLSSPPNTPHKLKPLNPPHQTYGSLLSLQISVDSTSKQHQMKKPTSVLAPNFKCRALDGMERAFHQLQNNGYKPDLVVFNSMLSIFARNNMYDRANDMLYMIHENGLQPDLVTYNSLMDMYARKGECWKAEEILMAIQKSGGKPDLVSYNTVIKGFCRQGYMQEAIRILSEMTTRGFRPCIFTYNTFITGYAGQGMLSEIDEVISYMTQNNCRPNELSYKIALDGYCKARKYKEAMDFLSKIKEIDTSFDGQYVQRLASRIRGNLHS